MSLQRHEIKDPSGAIVYVIEYYPSSAPVGRPLHVCGYGRFVATLEEAQKIVNTTWNLQQTAVDSTPHAAFEYAAGTGDC
jgi:hypothetical protein